MLTLATAILVQELGNYRSDLTGGYDGVPGMEIWPLLGLFENDLFGRTYYIYVAILLLLIFYVIRRIVYSPFGRSLTGIRENMSRMHAIGSPVSSRMLIVYTISAALAGISGALIAQTSQFVGLGVLSLERSGTVLIMLIIGGIGQLYGAFIGMPLYMIAQDRFSEIDPVFWYFWIGLFMIFIVVFARGGVRVQVRRVRRQPRRFCLRVLTKYCRTTCERSWPRRAPVQAKPGWGM